LARAAKTAYASHKFKVLYLKLIFIFIVLFFFNSSALADEVEMIMKKKGFVERGVPEVGSEAWFVANRNSTSYQVSLNKSLVITIGDGVRSNLIFDAGTVKYVGVDHGEFGGGLYLNDYKKNEEPFFSANIRALVPINSDLYIISGLAHLNSSKGAIHVIRNYKLASTPKQITLLPDAPNAVSLETSLKGTVKILIVGHSSLMEFVPDSDFDIAVFNAFWASLYPTSIVEYKNSYYIGIRSGVAVVTPGYGKTNVRYFVAD
jgi:hypothetical protein